MNERAGNWPEFWKCPKQVSSTPITGLGTCLKSWTLRFPSSSQWVTLRTPLRPVEPSQNGIACTHLAGEGSLRGGVQKERWAEGSLTQCTQEEDHTASFTLPAGRPADHCWDCSPDCWVRISTVLGLPKRLPRLRATGQDFLPVGMALGPCFCCPAAGSPCTCFESWVPFGTALLTPGPSWPGPLWFLLFPVLLDWAGSSTSPQVSVSHQGSHFCQVKPNSAAL